MTILTPGRKANFLRLVEPPREVDPLGKSTFARHGWQNTLFADEHSSLLVVVEFERLAASDFLALIATGNPRVVFDLRRVPRFDISHLNRRLVFDIFIERQIEYVDLSGRLGSDGGDDARIAAAHLAKVSASRRSVSGPFVLLVDQAQSGEEYISEIVDGMPAAPGGVWDVLKLPLGALANPSLGQQRNLVFVSHANPEDNNFAAWLCGKLAIAGYQVWSDITKLVGGEVFWDDIEEAIRYNTSKFIVVLSNQSQNKDGVLDEIDLAIRVERSNSFDNFVIPVRIDDLPFTDIRANLSRKNVIDFNRNWAGGLTNLLSAFERDGVARSITAGANALSKSLTGGLRARSKVALKPETLIANWLPVRRLPEQIDMIDIDAPVEAVRSLAHRFGSPAFPYLRLIGIFGDDARDEEFGVDGYKARIEYRVPMTDFLGGTSRDLPGLARGDARRYVVNLVRQAWDESMIGRGLRSFETASGTLAWYLPRGFADGDRVSFIDDGGIRRRKQLVGWSNRRQVFWHAAFDARFVLAGDGHVVLRQHVVFTEDGSAPIGNAARMHALRRSFCKSWWNDRWRDLYLGFVAWLSEEGAVRLATGPSGAIFLDAPLRVVSPVTPEIEDLLVDDEAEQIDLLDGPGDDMDEALYEDPDIETAELRTDEQGP